MPKKGISYEQVAKTCTDLEQSQRLSVRAIQARTGGSMTTVLKYYRRWQRERSGQQGVETVISDRLRHALLSELEETAAQSRQTVQQQLQEAQRLRVFAARSRRKKSCWTGPPGRLPVSMEIQQRFIGNFVERLILLGPIDNN